MTEFTNYSQYIQAELVNLGKQREPLATGLLRLWDTGVDGIICSSDETEWLVSITTHPSLRQRLQDVRQLMQGVPNQTHALMEQINSAIHTMMTSVLLAAI